MRTSKDYTTEYKVANSSYGEITVPKGTKVTHMTAMGEDKSYHFVDEFDRIKRDYPTIARILEMDMRSYGLNVPKEYIDYGKA